MKFFSAKGFGADLPSSTVSVRCAKVPPAWPNRICIVTTGSRTAKIIATGVLPRRSKLGAAGCNDTCCIWERSMTASRPAGPRRPRYSIRSCGKPGSWRCIRPIVRCPNTRWTMECRCDWINSNCAGRDNGAPAGWPLNCGTSSSSMSSGESACPIHENRPAGAMCCKP